MKPDPSVSVVIPCYNEEANIRDGVLDRVAEFVDSHDYCLEVIVVDDGSVDCSVKLVERFSQNHPKFKLLKEPHRGKAGAIISGLRAASGDYILFCDMDQATPIDELSRLRPFILEGYDVVVGSRSSVRRGAPPIRRLMARGYILLRRLILDLGEITDTQCGFKCYRGDVAKTLSRDLRVFRPDTGEIRGPSVSAAFDAELLFLARRSGYRIIEAPVHWHHVGTRRVHPVRESWQALRGLLQIRFNDARGKYDGSKNRRGP